MSFEQDTSSIGDLEKNLTELGGDPGRTDRELDNWRRHKQFGQETSRGVQVQNVDREKSGSSRDPILGGTILENETRTVRSMALAAAVATKLMLPTLISPDVSRMRGMGHLTRGLYATTSVGEAVGIAAILAQQPEIGLIVYGAAKYSSMIIEKIGKESLKKKQRDANVVRFNLDSESWAVRGTAYAAALAAKVLLPTTGEVVMEKPGGKHEQKGLSSGRERIRVRTLAGRFGIGGGMAVEKAGLGLVGMSWVGPVVLRSVGIDWFGPAGVGPEVGIAVYSAGKLMTLLGEETEKNWRGFVPIGRELTANTKRFTKWASGLEGMNDEIRRTGQVRPVRRGLQVLGVAMTELVGKGKQKIGEAWGRLTKGTKKDTEDVNDLTVVD